MVALRISLGGRLPRHAVKLVTGAVAGVACGRSDEGAPPRFTLELPWMAQRYGPETEYPMSKAQDSTTQPQAGSQPKPRGKALQVNENRVEDAGPPHASPPAPEKPREQRKEKQQGEAIRVNENTE
jgi:hypothetical protein